MAEEQFCGDCSCSGEPLDLGTGEVHVEKNWDCPLIGTKICQTCCHHELAGGMGAPDTLRGMVKRTGKSPSEIHATCVKCPHGGPKLDEPHKLISVRGEDGNMHSSGPEFETHDREFKEAWEESLEYLKKDRQVKS